MPIPAPPVYLIEDDPSVRQSLESAACAAGLQTIARPTADLPEVDAELPPPIVLVAAHASAAVLARATSDGRVVLYERPIADEAFVQLIRDTRSRIETERAERAEVAARLKSLSTRERQVLEMLLSGRQSKHIATELSIGEKTVLKHRSRMLEKMRVESIAELAYLVMTRTDLAAELNLASRFQIKMIATRREPAFLRRT